MRDVSVFGEIATAPKKIDYLCVLFQKGGCPGSPVFPKCPLLKAPSSMLFEFA